MAKFDFIYNNISLNASTAIIGGADGPTAIFVAGRIGDSVLAWIVGLGAISDAR